MVGRRESKAIMEMMNQGGGGANRQVTPISEDDELYFDDDIPFDEEESPMLSMKYRRRRIFNWREFYEQLTYDNAKLGLRYLMTSAAVKLSFNVSRSCHVYSNPIANVTQS